MKKMNRIAELTLRRSNYRKFSQLLSSLLNQKELADFDEYWGPIFSKAPNGYMKIGFLSEEAFSQEFPLVLSEPFRTARIEFVFEQVSELLESDIPDVSQLYPQLSEIRNGSGIVELGGIIC
jgi:hypothetical protein